MPEAANESGPFRVRDESTGHEYTTAVVWEGQTVLKGQPAVDENGRWLPAVHAEKPAKASAAKEAGK